MEKPKSSFDDLHNKLIDKNITLDNYSKEQVIDYLKDRSYYYKISSYRKNFPKDSKGKYINLNFVDLTNCASLDVRLRELLLLMCLDVEHSLKTKFMAILTEDEREDGYSIIEEFEDNFNGYEKTEFFDMDELFTQGGIELFPDSEPNIKRAYEILNDEIKKWFSY